MLPCLFWAVMFLLIQLEAAEEEDVRAGMWSFPSMQRSQCHLLALPDTCRLYRLQHCGQRPGLRAGRLMECRRVRLRHGQTVADQHQQSV